MPERGSTVVVGSGATFALAGAPRLCALVTIPSYRFGSLLVHPDSITYQLPPIVLEQ